MEKIQHIIKVLYDGLYHYVPNRKKKDFREEFRSRKSFTTKFALDFFPRYIDFEKWSKNPKKPYDIILINYWMFEVPDIGLKSSELFFSYIIGNRIIDQRLNKNSSEITKLKLNKKKKIIKNPPKKQKTVPQESKVIKEINKEDTLIKRVDLIINKSDDFKKALIMLLEDEERYINEIEKNSNIDDIETSLSDFIIHEEGQIEKLEKLALNVATNILQRFEVDYKEIELLQGKQRELRVTEFKKELFEQIIKSNSLYLISKDYALVYEKEMKKFLSIC